MKISVTCGCGSSFQAPESLAGQSVRCPACKTPLTVPAANAAPQEPEVDLSDLTSLDQPSPDSSAHGSTAGRTAMGHGSMGGSRTGSMTGSRVRKPAKGKSKSGDSEISQELDDRMTRMYEVYAGKKATFAGGGSGGITKLLIGMGIAVIIVGVAVAVGWNIIKKEYGDPMDSLGGIIAGAPVDGEQDAAPAKADRVQHPDVTQVWAAGDASVLSGAELKTTEITLNTEDDDRLTFSVKLVPVSRASDRRLSMAASVALFRSTKPDGPFTQADRVNVEGYDRGTGSLSFDLFDKAYAAEDTNLMYYRLTGYDSDGKRLFDTPATRFSCTSTPTLDAGNVTWRPKAEDQPLPALRIGARLDAPGWEDVLLWQVRPDGALTEPVPDTPAGLPVVVESAVYQPTGITLDDKGVGRWEMQWVGTELNRAGASGKQLVGIKPYLNNSRLDLRTVPGDQPFASVTGSWGTQVAGVTRVLNFKPNSGPAQSVTVATPPALDRVTATAYDSRVHLAWDNAALLAGLDRYTGELEIHVRRTDAQGNESLIAQLPTDQAHYTDADVANGESAAYHVALVQANAGGAAPTIHTRAWVQGHGELPVLAPFPAQTATARVAPEPRLDQLFVSLGVHELSYAGTGPASVAIQQKLLDALDQASGVAVLDRAALHRFAGHRADASPNHTGAAAVGRSAQLQLRLVDRTTPDGDRLALWVTDHATGQPQKLASALADEAADQADVFVDALMAYLDPRLPADIAAAAEPTESPRLVVVGPIYPVQQSSIYYHTDDLTAQLAEAADQADATRSVVTRAFWVRDTQRDPATIDVSGLNDAVLVAGRAWTTQGLHPAVSLHAVHGSTGRIIARFDRDEGTPEAIREFADWCAALKIDPDTAPSGGSPLLLAEASLAPIHPVWQQNTPNASSPGASPYNGADAEAQAVTVSFGLPLPSTLSGVQDVTHRELNDPLCMLRPYVAPQPPLGFDAWAKAYAEYIEADAAAFTEGFEQIRRYQQVNPGEFAPRLILRGEEKFVGQGVIPAGAGGLRVTPTGLNVRSFFPMGVAQQPMLDYRQPLSDAFRANPWLMWRAWKQVKPAIADPFLRGELFGVKDGRYERLLSPTKPAPFATYLAADILAERGNREAYNYKQKSLSLASQALTELGARGGARLNSEQMQWSTDALLVLIYEKDPGTITQMADRNFRSRFFEIKPEAQADTLRMLVDHAGPVAWEWAEDFEQLDWPAFCWRSYDEMDAALRSDTCPIPEEDRILIRRAWRPGEATAGGDPADVGMYPGSPTGRIAN